MNDLEGYTFSYKVKKKMGVMPKAKIIDAENGAVKLWASKKVEKGIYDLELVGNDGKVVLVYKVEVV